MYDYSKLCEIFQEKKCKLLTTEDELKQRETKIPKVKFIASCGHENEVFVNVFIHRNTGVVCKMCLYEKSRNDGKAKKNSSNHEYRGYLMLKELLERDFEVRTLNEGCLADCVIRLKGVEDDAWLRIQLKTTSSDNFNMYSFCIKKSYPECFIVCIQLEKELFWVLDGNKDYGGRLNITQKYSKYDKFEVKKDKLAEYFKTNYERYEHGLFEEINTPIGVCQQREQEYRRFRESKVDLDFIYPEEDGLVYDFTVDGKKFQEKVGTIMKGKSGITFFLHKNAGKKDGKRIYQTYNTGDNDFYWLNFPDKIHFFIIPENVLVMKGIINEERVERSCTLLLNTNYKNNETYWANKFLLDYNNLDADRLREILDDQVNLTLEECKLMQISSNAVRIGQYDKEGILIAEFPSITEASKVVGINYTVIAKVCDPEMVHYKTAGGFVWKYMGENHVARQNRSSEPLSQERKEKIKESKLQNCKKVMAYDNDNVYIMTFDNATLAAEKLSLNKTTIIGACQGKKGHKAYGFYWRYETT